MAAAASDWATSSWHPSPVRSAWTTPARIAIAPNTGPALMPTDGCSGMNG